jgi:hypothetical protein
MTNAAGAQIVNAVGPIRQIVEPDARAVSERRYLAILLLDGGRLGRPVQLQKLTAPSSAAQ